MSADPELVHRVRRIVAAMDPGVREAFLLNCLAERSYSEIAEWLSIPLAEVEARLAEAIILLAEGLRDSGEPA